MNDKPVVNQPTEPWQTREAWDHFQELSQQNHERQHVEIERLRSLLQDVVDDMTFNVAPNVGTMAKIREALYDRG